MEGTGFLFLRIIAVIPETRDTLTFVLEEENGRLVPYEAGQFLTFIIDYYGKEVRRSYSFGSTPGIDQQLYITVKRKENGEISRHVLSTWQKGTILRCVAPSGRFTIQAAPQQSRQVLFLAAGSGIVPVFSLIKKILQEERQTRVTLLYQNHDESLIIYHQQLEIVKQQFPERFHRINLLSHPLLHEIPAQRLNNGLLETIITSLMTTGYYTPGKYSLTAPSTFNIQPNDLFYTCGPPAFMRMVQFTLRVMGFAEEQLRKENFTIDTVPPPAFTIDTAPRQVTVHIGDSTVRYEVIYPTTILQAALNNQIELPYSCKGGRCATCTAICLQGKVKMTINDVLTEKDLQQGLVLTCVGFAETDVELKI